MCGGRGRSDRRGDGVRRRARRRLGRHARRRRGAAARAGRHPRARQRAGAHRVGGLRDRDPRGRGRRGDHDRRHAAQLGAGDDDGRRRSTLKRSVAEGQCSSTSGSGAARSPATSPTWRRCTRPASSGSSASCWTPASRSSRTCRPRRSPPRWRETARLGALMIVHAEDGDADRRLGARRRATTPASWPRGRGRPRRPRSRWWCEQARATGGRAHVVHLSDADAVPLLRAARADGVDVSVETCPHYLTFDAEHVADGATELKCCPPIREAENREALWAALARRRHRRGGVRPLAVHGGAQGQRRLRAGVGRDLVGAARPAGGVDGRAGARALAGRRGALDGVGARRPRRARPTGAGSRSGRRPTSCASRRTRRSRWTWLGSSTATRCRRTPAAASWARYGRPGCAAYPSRTTMGPEDDCWCERSVVTATTCRAAGCRRRPR